MMKFELPEQSSIIKVIGVGGGGSNAVNHMYKLGIKGVDFIVCNTDKQALDMSPVPTKIALGQALTEGRGAGSLPEVGRNAAIENIEEIRELLGRNTKMVFITAGMGGGTGTGAAPIIANVARELGILTVGIVTVPFAFEGKKRKMQAEEGLEQLKQNVDTLLVICNDKLREMHGNLKLTEAFGHADNVLTTAAKSIAEIISITQQINVDFADVRTVMKDSGVAIMGSASATGENRALKAVEQALNSPLLNDSNIEGARYVLLNITSGTDEITMDELGEITDYIQEEAGMTAELIKGYGVDETLGDKVNVTIIATGFNRGANSEYEFKKTEKVVLKLDDTAVAPVMNEVSEAKVEERLEEDPLMPFLKSPEQVTLEFEAPVVSETAMETLSAEISSEEQNSEVDFETPVVSDEQVDSFTSAVSEENSSPISESNISDIGISSVASENTVPEFIQQINEDQKAAEVKAVANEEQMKKAQERILRLKELSLKLKTPSGLNELENEPAYKRRNVNLDNVPHSSESQVSRFALTETEDKKIEIRPSNSFLHDNVD